MIVQDVKQGTPEWEALRAKHDTASEASVMMGCGKIKRSELVRMKATGDEQEFSRWVKDVLFENGHEVERKARPIAEEIVGEDLFPVVALDDDGNLLSSYDGLTMLEDTAWECKQWNEEKARQVEQNIVPEVDYWQVVQQLHCGAKRVLYMVTDGTKEKCVWMWVELDPDDEAMLLAGWEQFRQDVANYTPSEVKPEPVGKAPAGELPVLRIELTGAVQESNLADWRAAAIAKIEGIKTDLATDNDFADAEQTVKWLKNAEDKLKDAKARALEQTADIDQLFKAMDEVAETARQQRLTLDKLVKAKKEERRGEIMTKARDTFQARIAEMNAALGGKITMPTIPADFAGVMKGKKTIASLQDAVDTELARATSEASIAHTKIQANLELLRNESKGYEGLFADAQDLVTTKAKDDLANVIKVRIAEAKQAEEARQKAEQEKAAQKAAAEAAAKEQASTAPAPADSPKAVETDPKPAPPPASNATQIRDTAKRPSDELIIDALAMHFRVHESKVIEWLLEMDLNAASEKMAANF